MLNAGKNKLELVADTKDVKGEITVTPKKVTANLKFSGNPKGLLNVVEEDFSKVKRFTLLHRALGQVVFSILINVDRDVETVKIGYNVDKLSGVAEKIINGKKFPLVDNPRVLIEVGTMGVVVTIGGTEGGMVIEPKESFKLSELSNPAKKFEVATGHWPIATVKKNSKKNVFFSTLVKVTPKENFIVFSLKNKKYLDPNSLARKLDLLKRPIGVHYGLISVNIGKHHQLVLLEMKPGRVKPVEWVVEFKEHKLFDVPYAEDEEKVKHDLAVLLGGRAGLV